MEKFEYYTPTRIIFGKDSEKRVGEFIKLYGGKKVLIVYEQPEIMVKEVVKLNDITTEITFSIRSLFFILLNDVDKKRKDRISRRCT